MTTAEDVLNQARGWIGTREEPPGSNHVPGITDWFGVDGAWCNMFVSRCLTDAGMEHYCAWVPAEFENAANDVGGFKTIDIHDGQPGDLILFNWDDGGARFDHIGFIEATTGTGYITIEGNVGDACQRLGRSFTYVGSVIRPPYDDVPQAPGVRPRPVLRKGSKGEAVRAWQTFLNVAADGEFGPITLAATKLFQTHQGLEVDGVVGPATWAAMDTVLAPPAPDAVPPFPGTTSRGSTGSPVVEVQQRLAERGWDIEVDGNFGPRTEAVVVAYQQEKGLEVDGIVGPETWNSLWTAPVT